MDYSFFDGLIDSVFVVNPDKAVVYCNEAAAKLCDSSVKRLAKGLKPMHEIIQFSDAELFTMPQGKKGEGEPMPYSEIKFKLKSGKEGNVQVAIQPFLDANKENRWVVIIRDVTIEAVLHAKYHKQLEEKEVYIAQLQNAQTQLENYSKNLEKMVEERTQEVNRANVMLNAIMESLGQGFLVFDKQGTCSDIYTRACETILEAVPTQRKIWDVLKINQRDSVTFKMWLEAVFSEQLPFESLKSLGPDLYKHSQDRHVTLDYFPLRDEKNKILNLVVVATDKTVEYQTHIALEKEKRFAKMIVKLITGKKHFSQFLKSAKDLPDEIKKTVLQSANIDHEFIFRTLHTLEGESATYSIDELWQASRVAQEIIEPLRVGEQVNIVELKKSLISGLDNIKSAYNSFMTNNEELLQTIGISDKQQDVIEINKKDIYTVLELVSKRGVSQAVYREISDHLLREPILNLLQPYKDVVTTIANKLNKKVAPLKFVGSAVKVYPDHYQEFIASLVHAFRNAVDHGIESTEDRVMSGKSEEGTITVSLDKSDHPTHIRMIISDDGGGISIERMKTKLKQSRSPAEVDKMTEYEVMQHIFDSGLTTKDSVGEYSGRGVGLNAVYVEAQKLGGRTWVESTPGKGTSIFIEIPDISGVAEIQQAS